MPFRASSTAVSGSTTSLTINKPAGTVEGDVLIATLGVFDATISTPSGWTLAPGCPVESQVSGVTWRRLYTFHKLAGPSEPASYSFAISVATQVSGGIAAYSGMDPDEYLIASSTGKGEADGTTVSTGSITPTVDGCTIVSAFTADVYNNVGPATWSIPGTTERFDVYDTGTFMTTALADEDQATAAAVSRTGTVSANSIRRLSMILALAPAPVGPPPGTVVIPEDERDAMVADMDAQIESLTNTVDDMTAVRDQLAAYPVA
jgi:hypothetical protein